MVNRIKNLKNDIVLSRIYNQDRNFFYYKDAKYPLGNNIINWTKRERKFYLDKNEIKEIVDFIFKNIKMVLINNNQYIEITEKLENQVKSIYNKYFKLILNEEDLGKIEEETRRYQINLINLFSKYDEINILNNNKPVIDKVPCSQYSPKKQLNILNLELNKIKGNVLDIGCGYDANLVKYLRQNNIQAYGIDRIIHDKKSFLKESSWLDFNYKQNYWNIIIAHMSFSNHFNREHLKKDGNYIEYAKKYMEILESLKEGGFFYYTPSLEFIEDILPKNKYKVENIQVKSNIKFKSTIIYKKLGCN